MEASFTTRFIAFWGALSAAAFAVGCPVYSDNSYAYPACVRATDCAAGYRCSGGYCLLGPPIVGGVRDSGALDAQAADAAQISTDDAKTLAYCANPNDCKADETCSPDGMCRSGDCTTNACINQFQCAVVTAGSTAAVCVHPDRQACGADHQCATSARCVDGRCTALSELCTDRTQCPPNSACVEGKCVATCAIDSQCPSGFLCRTAIGTCDAKAKACSITNDCGSKDLACVDGACVPRCGAAGACGDGGAGVCVDNGCVPTQKARSICPTDGAATGCAAGQICVHHACYTSCQAPDSNACALLPSTPMVCKTITVGAASYSICGSAENLGTDCDPTADKRCAGAQTCVDGFCR